MVEYIVAIDVTRVRFPADAFCAAPVALTVAATHTLRPVRQDTLPERSKGVDSSSTSASCVGSNPTGVIFLLRSIDGESIIDGHTGD